MSFYKAVNLISQNQEKLAGWIPEGYAGIGRILTFKIDSQRRQFTVTEVGDQLLTAAQLNPGVIFEVDSAYPVDCTKAAPEAVQAKAGGKAPKGKGKGKKAPLAAVPAAADAEA